MPTIRWAVRSAHLMRLRILGMSGDLAASSVVYEGLPTYPDAGRPWRIAEELDVNICADGVAVIAALGPPSTSLGNADGSGKFREAPSDRSLAMRIFAYVVLLFLLFRAGGKRYLIVICSCHDKGDLPAIDPDVSTAAGLENDGTVRVTALATRVPPEDP